MKFSNRREFNGGYFSSISTDDGEPMTVRINGVRSSGCGSGEATIWFSGGDTASIASIDSAIIAHIQGDPEAWFGRSVSTKTIEAGWRPCVRPDEQFSVSVPQGVRVFDGATREPVPDNAIPEDVDCDIIVQVQGVAMSRRDFYTVLKLQQVRVHSPPEEEPPTEVTHDDWMMDENYGFGDE